MKRKASRHSGSLPKALAWYFRERGWLHSRPDPGRRARGKGRYKRGYEIRIAVESKLELPRLQRLLKAAGFKPGRPFPKVNRTVQPVYGKRAVEQWAALSGKRR